MIILRLIHILTGVFWVGTSFFMVGFLEPAVHKDRQAGGKIMALIGQGPLTKVMPVASMLAVLSGIWMYWIDSAGFQAGWMKSATGATFTIGGLTAIAAIVIGLAIHRPIAVKMGALGREIAASGGPPTPAQAAQMEELSRKTSTVGLVSVGLLTVTVIAMAIARYV